MNGWFLLCSLLGKSSLHSTHSFRGVQFWKKNPLIERILFVVFSVGVSDF